MARNGVNSGRISNYLGKIMLLNKTAIRKMFHDEGIQVNVLALNIVERLVRYVIESMIIGAKFKKVKRAKPSNIQKISDEEIKAMLIHMDDRPF